MFTQNNQQDYVTFIYGLLGADIASFFEQENKTIQIDRSSHQDWMFLKIQVKKCYFCKTCGVENYTDNC